MKIYERSFNMATQIAATPILRGNEAINVINEALQKPDEKTRKAFEMLEAEFSKIIVKSLD